MLLTHGGVQSFVFFRRHNRVLARVHLALSARGVKLNSHRASTSSNIFYKNSNPTHPLLVERNARPPYLSRNLHDLQSVSNLLFVPKNAAEGVLSVAQPFSLPASGQSRGPSLNWLHSHVLRC